MAMASEIHPSPEARALYGKMVARADKGVLSIEATLGLGIDRIRHGEDPRAFEEIHELIENEWIDADLEGGGWLLH